MGSKGSAAAKASRAGPVDKATTDFAVRHMLEGHVRKAGNRIRVSMNLTDQAAGRFRVHTDKLPSDPKESIKKIREWGNDR